MTTLAMRVARRARVLLCPAFDYQDVARWKSRPSHQHVMMLIDPSGWTAQLMARSLVIQPPQKLVYDRARVRERDSR